MAIEDGVDVFWGTSHTLPLDLPSSIRRVLTIHDLTWAICPATMSFYNRFVHSILARKSIQQANAICVPSESTRQGLIDYLGASTKRIKVVQWGIEEHYVPRDLTTAARYIVRNYGTSQDYLCAVGTIEPRKNLGTLIKAFRILRDQCQYKTQLLVAGGKGWKNSSLFKLLAKSGLTEREVKFLGYVREEDMPYLYAGASVFVFPSFYEGFGFPVIEAMACGAPVVASNASAIPEIAGEAALLVDPHLPDEWAKAIWRVQSNRCLREQLTRSGAARASQFKWPDAARRIMAVLTDSQERTPERGMENLKDGDAIKLDEQNT